MSALTEKNSSKTIYFVANQQRTLRGGRSSLKKTLEELEEEFSNPRVDTIIHMYCKKCSKFVTNDNNFRSSYLSQVLVGKCISKAKANGFLDFCHPPSKSYDCSKWRPPYINPVYFLWHIYNTYFMLEGVTEIAHFALINLPNIV